MISMKQFLRAYLTSNRLQRDSFFAALIAPPGWFARFIFGFMGRRFYLIYPARSDKTLRRDERIF